ncbi:MAG: alanine--glyoxylate aminotransferase family protein [Candidatus Riflebacteria bacterium]|nr:alanine--glyoxylate aminotransferase family protein [Candidatus Riflebacteria bacterium]
MDQNILLMTPGPVTIESDVLLAGAHPLRHHRSREFGQLYSDCIERLKRIFRTQQRLYLTTSSGTGVMEAAIANHFSPGDSILIIETGKFGERFTEIARAFKLNVIPLKYPWGHRARAEDIARELDRNPLIRGVTVTFNETSTGVYNDPTPIGKLIKERPDVIFILDGVSGFGALPFDMDGCNVDVAISASHKGFLSPPGIGMIAQSDKAFARMEKTECHGYYFDLKHYVRNQALPLPGYPWTPAISVMFSLHSALEKIEAKGVDSICSHYHRLAEGLRAAVEAMGLRIFTQPDARSDVLTVIEAPPGIPPSKIVKEMYDSYSIMIATGQGEITGSVFRIATIGAIGERDMIGTVGSLELVLRKLGHLKEAGHGVAAMLDVFAHSA